MTVLTTSEGLVVIDTGLSPTTVRRQREMIEQELGRNDFRYIIDTHVHNDHAFANEVFPEATVVGHEQSVAEYRYLFGDLNVHQHNITIMWLSAGG